MICTALYAGITRSHQYLGIVENQIYFARQANREIHRFSFVHQRVRRGILVGSTFRAD